MFIWPQLSTAQNISGALENWHSYTTSGISLEAPDNWYGADSVQDAVIINYNATQQKQFSKSPLAHGGNFAARPGSRQARSFASDRAIRHPALNAKNTIARLLHIRKAIFLLSEKLSFFFNGEGRGADTSASEINLSNDETYRTV